MLQRWDAQLSVFNIESKVVASTENLPSYSEFIKANLKLGSLNCVSYHWFQWYPRVESKAFEPYNIFKRGFISPKSTGMKSF